jgi:hypothetical protein
MSYFERFKIKDSDNNVINPARDEGLQLLRRIFQALKPLGIVTTPTNRLSVDINNVVGGTLTTVGTVTAVTTVTTVTTVASLTNLAAIGGVAGFDQAKAFSRQAYNSGVRAKIT